MRRSIAMLTTGQAALAREEALALIEELAEVNDRLRQLQDGLVRLVALASPPSPDPPVKGQGRT
jgi:hypothetical protein